MKNQKFLPCAKKNLKMCPPKEQKAEGKQKEIKLNFFEDLSLFKAIS